ncbi:AAA family ATPase [Methylorubrum populi]
MPAVAGNFSHMLMVTDDEVVRVRFRLRATIDPEGDIEETFTYVTKEDEDGNPLEESRVSKQDRNAIQVYYLPARRDPADHISYSANALLGRALRSANWSDERKAVGGLAQQITDALTGNNAVKGIGEAVTTLWGSLHKGAFFSNPSLSFARNEIDSLLRHLTLSFAPGHGESLVDFSRLSDGQQSLLYISIVLSMRAIGDKVLSGESDAFDIDKLRPAIFTMIAVEEPENSLSPHYLGRVVKALSQFAAGRDCQAVVATHAPSLLRRADPENIRHLRLDMNRRTIINRIKMPKDKEIAKYVREGIQAFPELYFSRFVILGEGDSEEVVLPRLLAARGILTDDASISIVPLGGRHVNHFWRLLNSLGIPHVTLLDLDLARHQGGWGRIKYAAKQLRLYAGVDAGDITERKIASIPKWDSERGLMVDDDGWIARLEKKAVFFSTPLDLDLMMIGAYKEAYSIKNEDLMDPDEIITKSVLGKKHDFLGDQYTPDEQSLFDAYHARFNLGSKPSWHISAMAALDDEELLDGIPKVLGRLCDHVEAQLERLPE